MKKLKYIKTSNRNQFIELPILNTYEINKSSQEVSFSDIKCEFINKTTEDLPEKYQEVQIIDSYTNKIDYFGYVDNYSFNEMREIDKFTEINFTLLSPMKISTLRTFIAIGVYNLTDLIPNIILKPLINDGFTIQVLDVPSKDITVNFLSKTVEFGMNELCNAYNLWWFIDENKNIYVQEINSILEKDPAYVYDDTHKINGLQYITPTVSSYNYANVVNFSNVRVYERSYVAFSQAEKVYDMMGLISEQVFNLKKGDQILFKQPVDLKKENILKSGNSYETRPNYDGLEIFGWYTDNSFFRVRANCYRADGTWITSSNVGFKGDEDAEQEFLLIRDSFFSNLIVGFEYNGSKTIDWIESISSDSVLAWEIFRFYNDNAINDKKGILSDTGIVEITVDMNETWHTFQELQDIGLSFMNNNSLKMDGEILLKLDTNIFKIGDILQIDKNFFNGKYIVTGIQETFNNKVIEYFVTCKNANIINDYIDLFRPQTSEVSDDKTYYINVSHYNQESIKESFEVVQ